MFISFSSPFLLGLTLAFNCGNQQQCEQNTEMMESKEEEEKDRLSNLPESLLLHILSFLPTKSALKTRILTRRWRALWADSLDQHFDLNFRYSGEDLDEYINFVNQTISHHQDSNIRKFRCALISDKMFKNSWIDFAMKKKVQELDLYLIDGYFQFRYKLPDSFYEHRSLTSLKLQGCDLKLHRLESFSFLKNLSLCSVELEDDMFHELLQACWLLENLNIDSCLGLKHLCISTSCLRLRHLSIRHCHISHGLEIHAMKLLSLEIHECIYRTDHIFKISSAPKEASLHLIFDYYLRRNWSLGRRNNILFRIFKDLADTEVLSLGSSCVQVASIWELQNFPTYFHKLKHLKLETGIGTWERCGRWQLHGIASLLRRSPQLQTLIIEMCCAGHKYDEEIFWSARSFAENEYWESQESYFPCLLYHLKTINIYSHIAIDYGLENGKPDEYALKEWENEMKVVNFFLKTAMVLEKMTIQLPKAIISHDKAAEVLLEMRQKLEQLPKTSSRAQLLFL